MSTEARKALEKGTAGSIRADRVVALEPEGQQEQAQPVFLKPEAGRDLRPAPTHRRWLLRRNRVLRLRSHGLLHDATAALSKPAVELILHVAKLLVGTDKAVRRRGASSKPHSPKK